MVVVNVLIDLLREYFPVDLLLRNNLLHAIHHKHVDIVLLGCHDAAVDVAHVVPRRHEVDGEAVIEIVLRHVDEFRDVDALVIIRYLDLRQPVHVCENAVVVDRDQGAVVEVRGDLNDVVDAVLELVIIRLLILEFRHACLISGWRATSQTPPTIIGPASTLDVLADVLVVHRLQELLDRQNLIHNFLEVQEIVCIGHVHVVHQVGEGSAVAPTRDSLGLREGTSHDRMSKSSVWPMCQSAGRNLSWDPGCISCCETASRVRS